MLKDEIARVWGVKKVTVISVIVCALGGISDGFEKHVAAIRIDMKVEHEQKAASLRIVNIFRRVLGY